MPIETKTTKKVATKKVVKKTITKTDEKITKPTKKVLTPSDNFGIITQILGSVIDVRF